MWVWLEELDATSRRPRWSLEELAASAYDWGAFSAQGVAMVEEVESLPWAARRWLRGWVGTARVLGCDHAMAHDGCWDHPLLRDRLPASARASFAGLMGAPRPLLDRLDALPRTVAHHDTQWNNLFRESRTGRTSHGRHRLELLRHRSRRGGPRAPHRHQPVPTTLSEPSDAEEHDATATEAYLAGLRAYGWRGDDEDVRFAADATGALQMVPFAACFIAWLCPEFDAVQRWPEEMAEERSS